MPALVRWPRRGSSSSCFGFALCFARWRSGYWAGRSWRGRCARLQPQALDDLGARVVGSAVAVSAMRGTLGSASCSTFELPVFGPEVVAPLRDAMRFVDGEQRDLHGWSSSVEEPRPSSAVRARRRAGRARREQRVARRRCARRRQSSEELRKAARRPPAAARRPGPASKRSAARRRWRSRAHQGGNLVAQRLAAAGRHQHERIAARGRENAWMQA
jgi:hypothetical protein